MRNYSSNAVSCSALVALCALAACTTPPPKENFGSANAGRPSAGAGARGGDSGGGARGGAGGNSGQSGSGNGGGTSDPTDAAVDGSDPQLDGATLDGSDPNDAGEDLGTPDGLLSCGSRPVSSESFAMRSQLRAAAADCAIWHYCQFENDAAWLAHLIGKHREAPSESRLARVRDAFRQAMDSWSRVELLQFGPVSSSVPSAGKDLHQGQNFRDRIYSWPTSSRCRVEEQVVSGAYEDGFARILISARGLLALEYLLFYEGDDTACAASSATYATWTSLSVETRQERKLAYAQALADDVLALARAVSDAWSATGGDFRAAFIAASGYPDEQEAMNVLGWSLAYVDKELDDWKIGVPAGRTATSPVTGPESPYADVATDNWKANLRGFRSLFQGCGEGGEGLGFDDWLIEAGHGQVADDIISAWQVAQTEVDSLGPLSQTSSADLLRAHDAVRALGHLMKSQLLGAGSPINLKLPATLEGDTD